MSAAAPRITAGYDADAPREFVFPPATRRDVETPSAAADPAALAPDLAAVLTRLCGIDVTVAAMAGPALPGLAGWSADDGRSCSIGGGTLIAAALLSRDCGGAFECDDGCARSAHVARRAELLAAELRDALVPGAGGWQSCAPAASAAFAVTAGSLSDRIDVGVMLPPPVEAPQDHGDWPIRLRAVIDGLTVPVRLVVHEARMAVRAVRALGIGDVIPIATAHEVGLRVGTLALARGQVVETDGGPPQVRIVARPRRIPGEQP